MISIFDEFMNLEVEIDDIYSRPRYIPSLFPLCAPRSLLVFHHSPQSCSGFAVLGWAARREEQNANAPCPKTSRFVFYSRFVVSSIV